MTIIESRPECIYTYNYRCTLFRKWQVTVVYPRSHKTLPKTHESETKVRVTRDVHSHEIWLLDLQDVVNVWGGVIKRQESRDKRLKGVMTSLKRHNKRHDVRDERQRPGIWVIQLVVCDLGFVIARNADWTHPLPRPIHNPVIYTDKSLIHCSSGATTQNGW